MSKTLDLSFCNIVAHCAVAIYFPLKYFEQFFTERNNTHHNAHKNITKFFVILYSKCFPRSV